ncbi:hypothetical protein K443DRAFT_94865, partial [Laccaria amethystina LaAM-08-1]
NTLFNTVFTLDSDFAILPHYFRNTLETNDPTMTFKVTLVDNFNPLLILHLKSPGGIALPSRRQAADDQIRSHMVAESAKCPIKTLHGISAFGTQLRFYHTTTKQVTPPTASGVPPIHHWDCDLLDAEGEPRFRAVCEEIMEEWASNDAHP